ncbi:phosphohistidine phosphatase SixA [Candidatus Aminicenantes bacterium AC-335-K20]|jgi:phosphohistidine phosphatase|nr:phosphohistidine phosphatase SixA [SCandidatus Aminicenantes bacterium Aminicenantia_JdfR_composite]MCP2597678.1 phosphohistidine phosphatase SixA [Candidatus Aminicenantes bacterium AC-335-G13]MCP2597895.1 phosphohistidine phosphatase SixA [Candidatus Aminicenantes bacterium AC-335-L06]MCP2619454.1 phosphohistidine phosphatase SixA [Candidatus Aminicenantes bacterium AC-335-K20]
MKLFLVQHAEAKPKEEDPERSLSEKGRNEIKKVATFLKKQGIIKVNKIIHSRKTRAKQTAEILAEYLSPTADIEEEENLEPLADPLIWAKKLEGMNENIMLVGHLPHLSKLSAYLLCGNGNNEIIKFQMGGIVCLDRISGGNWVLEWMIIPDLLKNF